MLYVKLAYYREQDWNRFINMIDDRESMHDTWQEWHKSFKKTKKDLKKNGFQVLDVVVDLAELAAYCLHLGIKNDGSARAQFVQAR